jgi:hypothetical protein
MLKIYYFRFGQPISKVLFQFLSDWIRLTFIISMEQYLLIFAEIFADMLWSLKSLWLKSSINSNQVDLIHKYREVLNTFEGMYLTQELVVKNLMSCFNGKEVLGYWSLNKSNMSDDLAFGYLQLLWQYFLGFLLQFLNVCLLMQSSLFCMCEGGSWPFNYREFCWLHYNSLKYTHWTAKVLKVGHKFRFLRY